jgi:hypothetical protein
MGAGAAKAVRDKFKGIDATFGRMLKPENIKPEYREAMRDQYGFIYDLRRVNTTEGVWVCALQTKARYSEKSNLGFIDKSLAMASEYFLPYGTLYTVSMAYPGIGFGGLTKAEVQPLLEKHLGFLGDRLRVYDLGAK